MSSIADFYVVAFRSSHHAVAGAAVSCVIGHHRAKVKEREAEQASAPSQQSTAKSAEATPAR
jgi:hypothetical protein